MTPLQALQAALAGEHAAVYVFGAIGGRVSASGDPALAGTVYAAYTAHRGRRDQLVALVRATGATPVAAEVSYELPNAATTPAQLRGAALRTEGRCAEVYAATVGSTSGADRRFAVDALTDSAVRQLDLGARPEAFPGVPEL